MNIQDYIHLFTKVEDKLPEKDGHYLCIKHDKHNGFQLIGLLYESHQGFVSGSKITHWLDLSKLTTKERAVDFASNSFKAGCDFGRDMANNPSNSEWINEKQKDL